MNLKLLTVLTGVPWLGYDALPEVDDELLGLFIVQGVVAVLAQYSQVIFSLLHSLIIIADDDPRAWPHSHG